MYHRKHIFVVVAFSDALAVGYSLEKWEKACDHVYNGTEREKIELFHSYTFDSLFLSKGLTINITQLCYSP